MLTLRLHSSLRPSLLVASACVVALAACGSSTEPVVDYSAQPVVRAYLYAGEPVSDIQLTWTTTLAAEDTIPIPINDANVVLRRNGVTYTLVKAPGDSGYYRYVGNDLVVRVGDVFSLEANVAGLTLTATTKVPAPPGAVSLSSDTVKIPDFASIVPGLRPDIAAARLTIRWPGSSGALYYVTVENLETTRTPVIDTTGAIRFIGGRLIFPPTAADSFQIVGPMLTYLGRHRLRVFRINEEYAQLYASRQQDSRDLNEPLTNIHGGLGVFSAFASDTARFVAVRQ